MTVILTDDQCATLNRQIANLWGEVMDLRATMAERDVEQVKVESAILFLDRQCGVLRRVLASVVAKLVGRDSWEHNELYPNAIGGLSWMGNTQAPAMVFDHPKRRWSQFGSKSQLAELSRRHGIAPQAKATRECLVKGLWAVRALPGSIAYYRPPNYLEVEPPPSA